MQDSCRARVNEDRNQAEMSRVAYSSSGQKNPSSLYIKQSVSRESRRKKRPRMAFVRCVAMSDMDSLSLVFGASKGRRYLVAIGISLIKEQYSTRTKIVEKENTLHDDAFTNETHRRVDLKSRSLSFVRAEAVRHYNKLSPRWRKTIEGAVSLQKDDVDREMCHVEAELIGWRF